MKINHSSKLFLRDIYSYDIVSCHYTILENLGIDVGELNKDDKLGRNIQIGLAMKSNPKLTHVLRSVTESTISEHIRRNNLKDEEIILRQYDGIITTRPLKEKVDEYIPLELRSMIQHMIISIERDMYISFDGNKTITKGIPHNYPKMEQVYNKIARINFLNKLSIFSSMQKIKDEIMTSQDPLLYAIPVEKEKSLVFLLQYGETQMANSTAKIMDPDDVDRRKYYNFYIRPFFKSLVREFV